MEGRDRRHGRPLNGRAIAALVLLVLGAAAAQSWWTLTSERRALERLAVLARPGDLRMLSSETCPYCEAARRAMSAHAVRFDECFIERDSDCRALYEATQARGTPTLLVRGRPQVGFDVPRLITALEAPG
jgi:glutaredoxin